ncbi:serine dehydratase subunit alpha family protein [Senegalia massiliensis]|uniref:L-cysteine desulfidase family protein n=1 Tax=Senegalia massiliensis TaxID=1720316 RepID=UPI001030BBEB|nr:L-serine ammonia-lyase, iron-sulfur-dependent, subunit alpha [Senegalia massiliensis]
MELKNIIINILKNEVVPAMGCTEPVAVAFACAKSKQVLEDESIRKVQVFVSPNIYKNGLGVGIPNTEEVGLSISAALGISIGNANKGLELLEDVDENILLKAHKILKDIPFKLDIKDTDKKIYIEVNIEGKYNNVNLIIEDRHNNIKYIEKNNEIILNKGSNDENKDNTEISFLINKTIQDIVKTIEKIGTEDLLFLLDGMNMNKKMADKGLEKKFGIGVGYRTKKLIDKNILSNDLLNNSMMITAAGADARMSGVDLPVMSSNGSGNNGLTAILPIVAFNQKYHQTNDKLVKALAISHVINCYIKSYIGRLSALCGCAVAAGTGASAAITWLMGGSYEQIDGAIKNMIANISGMICDGAKSSCALKVSTSASVAVQSALLAINGDITFDRNGIIEASAEKTIKNLGILSSDGMHNMDNSILAIMENMI